MIRARVVIPRGLALVALVALPSACGDDTAASTGGGGAASSSATSPTTSTTTTTGGGGDAQGGGAGGAPVDLCGACSPAETTGIVTFGAIDEVSGVAASRLHDGVLFVHDDSGESARFFAVALDGTSRGTFTVTGATAVDWEDVAPAPCADGRSACLILADTGDNDEERGDVALFRVPEPATVGEGVTATVAAEAFPFAYPDGPHDVEAVAVHPESGVVTLITKAVPAVVYELRPPLTAGMTAVRIGEVALPSGVPLATGADVDPTGRQLAVRTYADVLLYPIAAGASAADALTGAGCSAPIAAEMQGEAVGFLADGSGFVTIPEGATAPVHVTRCE